VPGLLILKYRKSIICIFFRLLFRSIPEAILLILLHRDEKPYLCTLILQGLVAQLDRASDYGSEGLGFESLRDRERSIDNYKIIDAFLFLGNPENLFEGLFRGVIIANFIANFRKKINGFDLMLSKIKIDCLCH